MCHKHPQTEKIYFAGVHVCNDLLRHENQADVWLHAFPIEIKITFLKVCKITDGLLWSRGYVAHCGGGRWVVPDQCGVVGRLRTTTFGQTDQQETIQPLLFLKKKKLLWHLLL